MTAAFTPTPPARRTNSPHCVVGTKLRAAEEAACLKGGVDTQNMNPCRRADEHHAAGERVGQVLAARDNRLLGLAVRDEGIREERQQLVEEDEREQVLGQRHAHGRGDAQGESGEEPGLLVLVAAAHVADGVDAGQYPERGGEAAENHAGGVRAQRYLDAGRELEERALGGASVQGVGKHQEDDDQQCNRGDAGPTIAQVRPASGGERDESRRADRDEDGDEGQRG